MRRGRGSARGRGAGWRERGRSWRRRGVGGDTTAASATTTCAAEADAAPITASAALLRLRLMLAEIAVAAASTSTVRLKMLQLIAYGLHWPQAIKPLLGDGEGIRHSHLRNPALGGNPFRQAALGQAQVAWELGRGLTASCRMHTSLP